MHPLAGRGARLSYAGRIRAKSTRSASPSPGALIEEGEISPTFLDIFSTAFRAAGATCFLAEVGGVVAGGGAVSIHDGLASLGGAGTLPGFRGRGVQAALIQERVAFAAYSGCELAMVATMPGSGSQRNVERQRFRLAYTRVKFLREWR